MYIVFKQKMRSQQHERNEISMHVYMYVRMYVYVHIYLAKNV